MKIFQAAIVFTSVVLTLAASWSSADSLPGNVTQEGERIYEVKDGVIQYHKPSFTFKGDRLYEMEPGTNNVRYNRPSYKMENGRIYEMEPGTNNIRYNKPSYEIK